MPGQPRAPPAVVHVANALDEGFWPEDEGNAVCEPLGRHDGTFEDFFEHGFEIG